MTRINAEMESIEQAAAEYIQQRMAAEQVLAQLTEELKEHGKQVEGVKKQLAKIRSVEVKFYFLCFLLSLLL